MILPSKSTTTHVETTFDDTGRAEAEAFLSGMEADGTKAGEVFAEVTAKAESANAGAQELAERVKALEEKINPTRRVVLYGVVDGNNPRFNAPEKWRGSSNTRIKIPQGQWLIQVLGPVTTDLALYVSGTKRASSQTGHAWAAVESGGSDDVFVDLPRGSTGEAVCLIVDTITRERTPDNG